MQQSEIELSKTILEIIHSQKDLSNVTKIYSKRFQRFTEGTSSQMTFQSTAEDMELYLRRSKR